MSKIEDEFECEVIVKKDGRVCIDAHNALFFVYRHPELFGIDRMEESERYNFVMALLPAFENAAAVYRVSLCAPFLFLTYFIRLHKKNWKHMKHGKPYTKYEQFEITQNTEATNTGDAPFEYDTLSFKHVWRPVLPRYIIIASIPAILILTGGEVRKHALASLKELAEMYRGQNRQARTSESVDDTAIFQMATDL